jgi:NAD(P)-dependent dehydrogenase (short-subunit alcohol dehydrogenase family)
MQEFEGKVAVVTGAASGIGEALARHSAAEGMRVVISDVDEPGLERTAAALSEAGAEVVSVRTDVRKEAEVRALAERALDAFGGVHLLFNNAGVMLGGTAWELTDDDWRWVMDVNLFGVVNGLRVFTPILLEQGEPAHIVNTASMGGLTVGPHLSPYIVSKHAVVALSESVYYELAELGAQVGVSALCPGAVATGIAHSERIRPTDRPDTKPPTLEAVRGFQEMLEHGIAGGMPPDQVARIVFEAVREERFWIYSDDSLAETLERRSKSILGATNPVYAHDFEDASDELGKDRGE